MSEPAATRANPRPGFPVLTGLSAAARAVPASLLVALPGLVFLVGYDHLAYGLGLLAGVVLAGQLVAPRLARANSPTLAAALAQKFGPVAGTLAALVVILVACPLLAAELSVIGVFAEHTLTLAYPAAVLAAAVLVVAAMMASNETRLMWAGALVYVLLAASLLVPLGLLAAKAGGMPFPHLAFGRALESVRGLEEQLLEGGLVDFETFSAHATPFLRLAQLDVFALIVTLALGTAVLPHLLAVLSAQARPAGVRLSGAWAALFLMIVLVTVPALAAFAKLEIYGAIAKGTPLTDLPGWLEAPLRSGFVQIHGTSLGLLNAVFEAVREGHQDAGEIAGALAAKSAPAAERWLALDARVQTALLDAAKALADITASAWDWDLYRNAVLPAAAAAAGNETATLTQSALTIEPAGLLVALPGLSGYPREVSLLLTVGAISAALVTATSLARSVVALVPRRDRGPAAGFALAAVVMAGASAVALKRPEDPVPIVVAALAIGAAGLFPAAALGLAWRRATTAGVIAAIVFGTGVTLYYMAGTQLYPASFYATWPSLSNAGESAIEDFSALELDAVDAEDSNARTSALATRDALARGSKGHLGLANWAGIDSASAAVFGAPVGLATLVLVSLLTGPLRRRKDKPASAQP